MSTPNYKSMIATLKYILIKIIFAWQPATNTFATHGDLAQLVERLHVPKAFGKEVSDSTPLNFIELL